MTGKVFYIEGYEYEVPLEEYRKDLAFHFATEFNIPSDKAKEIIRDLDLEDMLSERYDEDIADSVPQIAAWLRGFGKRKYLFLTPEIALIEALAELGDPSEEVILVIPCDLEADAKERLRNNIPRGIGVTILEEPYFPQ